MTVRTGGLPSASGVPEPEAGRDTPLREAAPPDLTAAQKKRALKRIHRARKPGRYGYDDVAFVRCDDCGWVGFDVHLPHDPDVTPCPKCGCHTATFAMDY